MLYSNSIFCNLNTNSRPNNWYSTNSAYRLGNKKLTKFSWVKPRPIAFEVSFTSMHSPLHSNFQDENAQSHLKHQYVLPVGVRSFRDCNKSFWRNCAITYLIKLNHAYKERCDFLQLVAGLKKGESTPVHWQDIIERTTKEIESAKKQFKQCRVYEKT